MSEPTNYSSLNVKVYNGYGHSSNCIVYGHVLKGKPFSRKKYSNNSLVNIIHLVRLFFVRPVAGQAVQLQWRNQQFSCETEKDGFFKFEWQPAEKIHAGWHDLKVYAINKKGGVVSSGEGKILVPHMTQYAFISDIDDTVIISHSATKFRRLRVMFTRNPHTRKAFENVVKFYQELSRTFTKDNVPNPFFYVSSSEWNLYDDLAEFFKHNELPEGVMLLNQIKRWYQLFKTGTTKHQGKLVRVVRILENFPQHKFILLGDNSQSDPDIYVSIANKYPGRIAAIYIRNIATHHENKTTEALNALDDKSISTFQYIQNSDAILHAKGTGLIA